MFIDPVTLNSDHLLTAKHHEDIRRVHDDNSATISLDSIDYELLNIVKISFINIIIETRVSSVKEMYVVQQEMICETRPLLNCLK